MEKIILITGGNKGLGLGLSKKYHENGYRVISIARSKVKELHFLEQYSCDLSEANTIESTIIEIFSHLNKNNISHVTLINNAGDLGTINTIENLSPSEISYTIHVNLIAPLVLSSLFIRFLENWNCKKQIFNISSGAAVNPYKSWVMYCSSKAGLDMMTKVISEEQKNSTHKVSIASIYPGIVATNMQVKIRNTPKKNFKEVQRFIDIYKSGELFSPKQAATKIYNLDISGKLKNGSILDIRNV